MKSKFTIKSFIFPALVIILTVISYYIIYTNWPISFLKLRWIDYFFTVLFLITFIWLIFGEIYRKMIFVEIFENSIRKTNLIGNVIETSFSDAEGYLTKLHTTRFGNFEELVILKNAKSIIIVSEMYHCNYKSLKEEIIKGNVKYLGGAQKNYS